MKIGLRGCSGCSGIGDGEFVIDGADPSGSSTDVTVSSGSVDVNYPTNYPTGGPSGIATPNPIYVTGNASTGFNWGQFLTSLLPTALNDATKLTQQAIATPGTIITPTGVAVGTASGNPSTTAASATSSVISGYMPLIVLGIGAVVLISVLKKGH